MKHLGRGITAAGLVAGLLISIAPVASAHIVPSYVSLGVSDRTVRPHQEIFFFGDLRTPGHPRCHKDARIALVRRHTGVVARTRTDEQGTFVFKIDPKPNHGRYFARYRGSNLFGYNHSHGCLGDRSRLIHIRRA
ncbi:MAG: hypothetical protein M3P18_07375 [Actinomycetota bacterium]|nr:hypothetical protein [Actinomycetota bacterium]